MSRKTRYDLIREEAMKATGAKSIRELPLDLAYPEKHDEEAQHDFILRLRETPITIGVETNKHIWRDTDTVHIMFDDHALCRKSRFGTSYGKRIELEYRTREILFGEFKKYRWRCCKKCRERFLTFHKDLSGLF